MSVAESKLLNIPLSQIRENPVALRSVNKQAPEYVGLVDSIRRNGVLNAILVREVVDPDTRELVYGLIDGLHRFTASCDAGLTTIPAKVTSMEDAQVLEAQILTNVHKIETRPVEYSRQLLRILAQNPLMPLSELAVRLSRSTDWLQERLGLVKLDPKIAELVDEDKINLSNAYALAKLPAEEQAHFLDQAMTMNPQEFVPTANARAKEIRDAKRQGRQAAPVEFTPVPHVRKISELKSEMDTGDVGRALVAGFKVSDPAAAFNLGVRWALHMDPASVDQAKAKDEYRKKELKEAKEKRQKERLEKQQKEAAEKAARLQEQLASSPR